MSLGLWPEAVPFDPDSGTASHELSRHFDADRLAAAVLLVCARDLRGTAWPAQAAIALARAIATGSRPIVLVDLDFERPALHERLDISNSEGVADALLFGASLERLTLEPAGELFGFVTPGAVAPDPAALMASGEWTRLLAELAAGNSLMLAFAPLGVPGLDALAGRVADVIVLADEADVAATAAMLPDTIRVVGVIRPVTASGVVIEETVAPAAGSAGPADGPAGSPGMSESATAPATGPVSEPASPASPLEAAQSPEAAAGESVTAKEEARQALMADIEARRQATVRGPGGRTAAPARPASADRRTARPLDWKRLLPWAAFIIVASVAGWLGGRMLAGPADEEVTTSGANDGGTRAEPAGDLLGWSVAIEAYDGLAAADARVDSLRTAAPDLQFYVAPVAMDDATLYRVLAGPMMDSASASAAMRQLVQQGLKIAVSEFDVRSTPLAFLVGNYEFRGDAAARITELEAEAVPAYVIEVPYTQGPPRFHVYAGAYSGPTEAALMRERLRQAGIVDTLVLRVGRSGS